MCIFNAETSLSTNNDTGDDFSVIMPAWGKLSFANTNSNKPLSVRNPQEISCIEVITVIQKCMLSDLF